MSPVVSKSGFRQHVTPFTPPFVQQGDGITPALGNDLRVLPYLPAKRKSQLWQGNFSNFDMPIVIEAGEPVGVYVDDQKRPWMVPASTRAYSLTYGTGDVDVCEDIDNPGTFVQAAGASSATIGPILPIGLAHQPIMRNSHMSDGTIINDNFQPDWKAVAMRRRHFQIPYFRQGPNKIGKVYHGDLLAVGSVSGDSLSSTQRPKLVPARMSLSSIVSSTQGTITIVKTSGTGASAGDELSITVHGVTVNFEAGTGDSTAFHKFFAAGANGVAALTNLAAAINASALRARLASDVTVDEPSGQDPEIVLTALSHGSTTVLAYTEVSDDDTKWSATVVQGIDGSGGLRADAVPDERHIGFIVGRVLRVWEWGVPDTFDMSKVVTPKGSGLAGTGTNGVAQELAFAGNTFEGNHLPSDFTTAGALLLAYEL